MRHPKHHSTSNELSVTKMVTLQELTNMADFIRNFKLKYASKRAAIKRKKK
jgi:hypothetical protein